METLIQQLSYPLNEITKILIALAIGILIGLEREHALFWKEEELFAGARTYPLITLFGYGVALLSDQVHAMILAFALIGFLLFVTVSYFLLAQRGEIGATTEFSIFIAFLLGAMIYLNYITIAIAVAVIITVILSLKVQVQSLVQEISRDDIYATLKFIVVTALILPLLPDRPIDPYNSVNLRNVWYMVVLVSSLSFIGYILFRIRKSHRDILLLGFIGGLTSSTVLTWTFAHRAREIPNLLQHYGMAILVASYGMFLRILILIFIVSPKVGYALLLPLLLITVVGGGISALLLFRSFRKGHNSSTEMKGVAFKNPFRLSNALSFGVIYAAFIFIAAVLYQQYGFHTLYLFATLSGFFQTDAIVISLTKLTAEHLTLQQSQIAILLALLANSAAKYAITYLRGNRKLFLYTSTGFLPMIIVGFAILLFLIYGEPHLF